MCKSGVSETLKCKWDFLKMLKSKMIVPVLEKKKQGMHKSGKKISMFKPPQNFFPCHSDE